MEDYIDYSKHEESETDDDDEKNNNNNINNAHISVVSSSPRRRNYSEDDRNSPIKIPSFPSSTNSSSNSFKRVEPIPARAPKKMKRGKRRLETNCNRNINDTSPIIPGNNIPTPIYPCVTAPHPQRKKIATQANSAIKMSGPNIYSQPIQRKSRGRGKRRRGRGRTKKEAPLNSRGMSDVSSSFSPVTNKNKENRMDIESQSEENMQIILEPPSGNDNKSQSWSIASPHELTQGNSAHIPESENKLQIIRDEINKLKYQRDTINQQILLKEHEFRRLKLKKINELKTILHFYNFTTKEVDSEGDCFFDSLQCHLAEATVEGLRQITADRLQQALDAGELEGFGWNQERIEAVRSGKEWAGQEEISCIAKASAIRIKIWAFLNGDLKPFYMTEGDDEFDVYDVLHCNLDDPFCETASERNHYMPLFITDEVLE